MDWNWTLQLFLAVSSVIWERRNELKHQQQQQSGDSFQYPAFEEGSSWSSNREPRIAAVPPGAPITIGLIYVFPTTVVVLFGRRRRLADFQTLFGRKKKRTGAGADVDDEAKEDGKQQTKSGGDSAKSFPNSTISAAAAAAEMNVEDAIRRKSSELSTVVGDGGEETTTTTTSGEVTTIASSADHQGDELEEDDEDDEVLGDDSDADDEGRGFFDSWSLDADLLHQEQLSKIDHYFYHFEIDNDKCKRRIVCELAAAPETFYPVSDILLRLIRPKMPVTPARRSRFYRLLDAAKTGFNGDAKECEHRHSCEFGAADVFDDKMLQLFQLVGRELNIEFVDYE